MAAVLLFVSVLYLGFIINRNGTGVRDEQEDEVAIEKRYENKLVYTTDVENANEYIYREDCEQRGGTFNECGDVCPKDADLCAQVCAFTCLLEGDDDQELIWKKYTDQKLGFSIPYIKSMEVGAERRNSIEFIFTGPKQSTGTELYDGVRVVVSRLKYPEKQTLKEFSQELSQPAQGTGGEVVREVSLETEYDQFTYSFKVSSLGEYEHKIALVYPGEAFDVSYFVSEEDYDHIAKRMVKGFKITDERKLSSEKDGLVEIHSPKIGQSVSSPLVVEGQAKNVWFFEASFPVVLTDWDGRIMAQAPATTSEDWMSEGMHSFRAELDFDLTDNNFMPRGNLILRKSNPSGLPKNADGLEIPIYFE